MSFITKCFKYLFTIIFTFGLVIADPPAWDCDGTGFDGSNYDYSGSITFMAYFGPTSLGVEGDLLAAFVNGELRGLRNAEPIDDDADGATDRYIFPVDIYSNSEKG